MITAVNALALLEAADALEAMSRDDRRDVVLNAVHALAATRQEGVARLARILHITPHAILSWLKPVTSRSSRPIPLWAVELCLMKLQGATLRVFERVGGGHVAMMGGPL